eukprot:1156860-Pelagomonas_calceolata.AAC.7
MKGRKHPGSSVLASGAGQLMKPTALTWLCDLHPSYIFIPWSSTLRCNSVSVPAASGRHSTDPAYYFREAVVYDSNHKPNTKAISSPLSYLSILGNPQQDAIIAGGPQACSCCIPTIINAQGLFPLQFFRILQKLGKKKQITTWTRALYAPCEKGNLL